MLEGIQIFAIVMASLIATVLLHSGVICILNYIQDKADFPNHITVYPSELYKYTKMNMFGCIVCWIVLLPFAPYCTLGGLVRRLFTVGRRGR